MAAIDFKVRNLKSPDGVAATVAEVSGSIDATTINQFQTVMDKLVEKGVKNLIFDATNVKYINSTGLGTLLKYVDTFGGMSGSLVFVRVPSKVMLVMEMLGFNALFNIYEDENEALKFLGAQAPAEVVPEAPAAAAVAPQAPAPVSPVAPAAPSAPISPIAPAAPGLAPEPVAAEPSFPLEAACSRCSQALSVSGQGSFRCPRCGQVLEVGEDAQVSFPETRMPAPAELSLPASPALGGVVATVGGALARAMGMNGKAVKKVEAGLSAVFGKVAADSYREDATGALNVLILPQASGLKVEFVDNGAGVSDAAALRSAASGDDVQSAPHPVKGTVYTIVYNK